jgi:Fibronectin type III domain
MKRTDKWVRLFVLLAAACVIFTLAGCGGSGGGGTTVAQTPSAPSGLTATAVSSAGIELAWTDNADSETGFKIERGTDGVNFTEIGTTAANTAAYSDTGLSASTTYYYRVAATNSAGDSPYSNIANAATQAPAATAPAAPTSLLATAESSTGIDLTWTDNADSETGFKVERSTNNVSFTLIATTAADATSYSDTGLTASTTYYYRVAATNSAGDSAYTNTANATTQAPPITIPAAPSSLLATAPSCTAIDLSWTDNSSDETGFTIERSTDDVSFALLATVGPNTTNYTDTGLTPVTKYYYRVAATNSAGDSTYSNTANATTRILHFSDFQTASEVLGQPTFTSNAQSYPPGGDTLSSAEGAPALANGIFYLPDSGNNRVLGFNGIPAVNGASADFVLSEPAMNVSSGGTASTLMESPTDVRTWNGKLLVDDSNNSRILIWNSAPATTQAPADVVVGQADFTSVVSGCTATLTNDPMGFTVADGKLIVADTGNNRVLIWNSIPTTSGAPANLVLGQGDFTHFMPNDDDQNGSVDSTSSARTLSYPIGVWSDGTQLIVADSDNNRVLIWSTFPTTNFTPADMVLGQGDFTHKTSNDDLQTGVTGTATARTLYYPMGVDSNGTQVFLADNFNNRVLIWNTFPTANFTPADVVLGQRDFSHTTGDDNDQNGTYDGAPTGRTLFEPNSVSVSGTKLFVADMNNYRYLIFEAR